MAEYKSMRKWNFPLKIKIKIKKLLKIYFFSFWIVKKLKILMEIENFPWNVHFIERPLFTEKMWT